MPSKHQKYDGFLLPAYDLLGDICLTHNVQVGFLFYPTKRRGIFSIELRAARSVPNGKPKIVAKYTVEHPTAFIQELSAALFNACNKLDHMLAEQAAQELKERTV